MSSPTGSWNPSNPPTFATDDILKAMGRELKKITAYTGFIAFFAFVQMFLLALWVLGIVTISFEPV